MEIVESKTRETTTVAELSATISKITMPEKGILAADESTATITKRFDALHIPCTEETRRTYRELLLSTPGIEQYIAGVILYEETLNQKTKEGIPFAHLLAQKGILAGIKVDKGLIPLQGTNNENVTQGLDGLAERLAHYKNQGASFTKWRAVYAIAKQTPSSLIIRTNADILARYASICQSLGLIPIVEPEVLIDGDHSITTASEVSEAVLHEVFHSLHRYRVLLEYIVLKPSMVVPGKAHKIKATPKEVAEATLTILRRTVPAAVPTINFLSGGQSPLEATSNLNEMNRNRDKLSWNLGFSYARALQEPCMKLWAGQLDNIKSAQQIFYHRAKMNSLASLGIYTPNAEEISD